jgi:hypothetical protein
MISFTKKHKQHCFDKETHRTTSLNFLAMDSIHLGISRELHPVRASWNQVWNSLDFYRLGMLFSNYFPTGTEFKSISYQKSVFVDQTI